MKEEITDQEFLFDIAKSLVKEESTIIDDEKFTKGINLILDSIEVNEIWLIIT